MNNDIQHIKGEMKIMGFSLCSEQLDTKSFGNFVVEFKRQDLIVRITSDRGQILIEIKNKDEYVNDNLFSITEVVDKFSLIGTEIVKVIQKQDLEEFYIKMEENNKNIWKIFKANVNKIINLFDYSNYQKTKKTLLLHRENSSSSSL